MRARRQFGTHLQTYKGSHKNAMSKKSKRGNTGGTTTVAFRIQAWRKLEYRAQAARNGVLLGHWLRRAAEEKLYRDWGLEASNEEARRVACVPMDTGAAGP